MACTFAYVGLKIHKEPFLAPKTHDLTYLSSSIVKFSLDYKGIQLEMCSTYENEVNLKTTQVRKGLWRNWKMLTLKTQEEVGKITHQSIDVDSRK